VCAVCSAEFGLCPGLKIAKSLRVQLCATPPGPMVDSPSLSAQSSARPGLSTFNWIVAMGS
jgi:hypothetical protein